MPRRSPSISSLDLELGFPRFSCDFLQFIFTFSSLSVQQASIAIVGALILGILRAVHGDRFLKYSQNYWIHCPHFKSHDTTHSTMTNGANAGQ